MALPQLAQEQRPDAAAVVGGAGGMAVEQRLDLAGVELVPRHGGRIEVEPNPDGGTCFVVTLPAAPPPSMAQAPGDEQAG